MSEHRARTLPRAGPQSLSLFFCWTLLAFGDNE